MTFKLNPFTGTLDLVTVIGSASGGTTGSVVFIDSSGNFAQDNASFFYTDSTNRLRVGSGSNTSAKLTLYSESDQDGGLYIGGFAAQLANHLQITPAGLGACELSVLNDGSVQWNPEGTPSFQSFEMFGGAAGANFLFSAQPRFDQVSFGTDSDMSALVGMLAFNTGDHTLVVRQLNAQTGRLTAWQSSAPSILSYVDVSGNFGIRMGATNATAYAHFAAGTTAASTAPIKLTSGSLMTAPEVGAIEFLTDSLYYTITTGTARKQIYAQGVTVAVADGGTGLTSYTQGQILYASAAGTIAGLSDVATGSVLVSGGASTAPAYSASPTITTSVTCPLLIGGTATSSTLTLQSTSGNGVAGADILFKSGNNGGTEIARARWDGTFGLFGIGVTPTSFLHVNGASPASVAGTGTAATAVLTVLGPSGGSTSGTAGPTGGTGSNITLGSGAGGSANSGTSGTATGGAGGLFSATAGAGQNTSVSNASVTGKGGTGGASSLTSGAGGTGQNSSGASTGGSGGACSVVAGNGGSGSGSGTATAGQGGAVAITAGSAGGVTSGSTQVGAVGGAITITGGTGSNIGTGAGTNGGAISINSGVGGTGTTASGSGGGMTISSGNGASQGATTGGAGGVALYTSGNGSSATTTPGLSGTCTLSSGTGGSSSNAGVNAAAAGLVSILGGTGGSSNNSGAGGNGAGVTIKGGAGGSAGSGTNGSGGQLILAGGVSGSGGGAAGSGGIITFQTAVTTSLATVGNIDKNGRWFLGGSTTATAILHLAAGTASASTAPLKMTSGTLLTSPEAGAQEFLTDKFYATITTGTARKEFSLNDAALTSGIVPVATTNGRLTDSTLTATKIAKPLFDHFADVGNIGTGEDDLYSDTIAAGQLAGNGDKLNAEYGGTFVSSATATREIKLYFGGTMIFDTGALTLSLSAAWVLYVTIIRVSSSVIRYSISLTTEGAALAAYTAVGELTGLTLANTQVMKITGEAAGVGAATNDVTAKLSAIIYQPAA